MTFLELAKAAMPGASDAQADYALWNHTPFPFDKRPRVLFKKISGYRRACANGLQLCGTCDRIRCCQWPANGGRLPKDCPVERGGYDDAARAAINVFNGIRQNEVLGAMDW